MTFNYDKNITEQERQYTWDMLNKSIDVLSDLNFGSVYFCAKNETTYNYLTCYNAPQNEDDIALCFMFDHSHYTQHNRPLFKSNTDYIKREYPDLFWRFFTEDTLTSDCEGIMLNVTKLRQTILNTHDYELLTSIDMLLDDLHSLENYIALNEDTLYKIEYEMFLETWKEFWGKDEFVKRFIEAINYDLKRFSGKLSESELWEDDFNDLDSNFWLRILDSYSEKYHGGETYIIDSEGAYINGYTVEQILQHDKYISFISQIADEIYETYLAPKVKENKKTFPPNMLPTMADFNPLDALEFSIFEAYKVLRNYVYAYDYSQDNWLPYL